MKIQLSFENPLLISPLLQQDNFFIDFKGLLVSADGRPLQPEYQRLVHPIRPQLDGKTMTKQLLTASSDSVDYILWVLLVVILL